MRRIGRLVTLALGGVIVWLAWPATPVRHPALVASAIYSDAAERIERLRARDSVALHPGCGTTALLHGGRTARAVVLLHGITNCPLQFLAVGESLHARGDNVLIPRVPHHGLADRMGGDLQHLGADEMAALVTECVGIARGLGDTVVIAGLSTSGVAAAWAAQFLPVDRAVLIAPAFAPAFLAAPWPSWVAPALTRVALRTPNRFVWWDDRLQRALPGPEQCYYGFSTRALAEAYRLGDDVGAAALRPPVRRPRARDVVLLRSDADHAVDNARAVALCEAWIGGRGLIAAHALRVREVCFPDSLRIVHDMIDPHQVGARTEVVYPVLIALIQGEAAPGPAARWGRSSAGVPTRRARGD
jgi:alpha-beta hydrolase superfamily lysophospholipase